MAPASIEIAPGESPDMLLGQLVQAVNGLIKSNEEAHEKIFKRLDEGDQYLVILKASKCTFAWLDKQGVLKGGLLMLAFFAIDWISRYIYWDVFPKP